MKCEIHTLHAPQPYFGSNDAVTIGEQRKLGVVERVEPARQRLRSGCLGLVGRSRLFNFLDC